jgi:hypothetical protein
MFTSITQKMISRISNRRPLARRAVIDLWFDHSRTTPPLIVANAPAPAPPPPEIVTGGANPYPLPPEVTAIPTTNPLKIDAVAVAVCWALTDPKPIKKVRTKKNIPESFLFWFITLFNVF